MAWGIPPPGRGGARPARNSAPVAHQYRATAAPGSLTHGIVWDESRACGWPRLWIWNHRHHALPTRFHRAPSRDPGVLVDDDDRAGGALTNGPAPVAGEHLA